jgi:hypothetical protein
MQHMITLTSIITFVTENKAAIAIIAVWCVREISTVTQMGGLVNIIKGFLFGTQTKPQTQPK